MSFTTVMANAVPRLAGIPFSSVKKKSMIPSDNSNNQQPAPADNSRSNGSNNSRENVNKPDELTEQDLPESDNESIGAMGSGQRQDSN